MPGLTQPRSAACVGVKRDQGRTRTDGAELEYLLSGRASLRLSTLHRCSSQLDSFLVNANIAVAPTTPKRQARPSAKSSFNPFDDVFARVAPRGRGAHVAYMLQLKQSVKTNTIRCNQLAEPSGDYSITKYYNFYKYLKVLLENDDMDDGLRSLFQGLRIDDFRFILFTTNEVQHTGGGSVSFADFPFASVFSTGSEDSIFSFGPEDRLVWDLFKNTPDCSDYQQNFLPKFLVYSNQLRPQQLENLLKEELYYFLGCKQPEIALKYVHFLKEWWSKDIAVSFSEKTDDVECIVKQVIDERGNCQKKVIKFSDNYCKKFASKLYENKFLYLPVLDIRPPYRASKVINMLRSQNRRFFHLNDSVVSTYSKDMLISISSRLCDVVLLDVDEVSERTEPLLRSLGKVCQVVVLTTNVRGDVESMCRRVGAPACRIDTWALEQLAGDAQREVLARLVAFQGKTLALGALQASWPSLRRDVGGAMLDALLRGEPFALGVNLPAAEPFVTRALAHRTALHDDVLGVRSGRDLFVLEGFARARLERLRRTYVWEECPLAAVGTTHRPGAFSNSHPITTKWCELAGTADRAAYFQKVCAENSQYNVHWLQQDGASILWIQTEGNPKIIESFIIKKSPSCQNIPDSSERFCIHSSEDDDVSSERVKLLLGESGIGKSMFVCHIARRLKAKNAKHWVVIVQLRHFHQIMRELHDSLSTDDILEILTSAAGCQNSWSKQFMKSALEESGNISVYIDGVDEICSQYKKVALSMLDKLLNTRVSEMWVASRSVIEEDLKRHLGVVPLNLLPFTEDDEVNYLQRFWFPNEEGNLRSAITDLQYVRELVETIRKSTEFKHRTLCDIPLHTHLLAVVYKTEMKENSERCIDRLKKITLTLFFLIKKFVCSKIDIFLDKSGIERGNLQLLDPHFVKHKEREVLENHMTCAAYLLFSNTPLLEYHIGVVRGEVDILRAQLEENKLGIITRFVDGMPEFIHQSFAEYFAAMWIKEHLEEIPLADPEDLGGAKPFLDAMLAEGHTLHEAALAGRQEDVLAALRSGAGDVRAADRGGRTAAHLAAMYGHETALQALLEWQRPGAGRADRVLRWTPLRYADAARHLRAVELLLLWGGDAADVVVAESDARARGLFAAVGAGCTSLTRLLLDRGVPKDVRDEWGDEVLHCAAQEGAAAMTELLLQYGCYIESRGFEEKTPLHKASINGESYTCLKLIQNGASVHARMRYRAQPLHCAALCGDIPTGKVLLQCGADLGSCMATGITPLHVAAKKGHGPFCQFLINNGVNVNIMDSTQMLPLHYAAFGGNVDTGIILLGNGAYVDARAENGCAPLHAAANNGHASFCEFLIHFGAKVNCKNSKKTQPLHYACACGDIPTVSILLKSGADKNAEGENRMTPLHIAAGGANRSLCQLLVENGAVVNSKDSAGRIPLHHAALTGAVETGKILLDNGSDVHSYDSDGNMPLHVAAQRGHALFCELISFGAEISCRDSEDMQPLHLAGLSGDIETCENSENLQKSGGDFFRVMLGERHNFI